MAVEDGAVTIDLSGADGFLSAILPEGGISVPFDVLVGFSSTRGVYVEGGAGLAVDIPIDVELGPIKLQMLHLGFTLRTEGLELEASGAIGASLGPFAMAVERMGMTALLSFPSGGGVFSITNLGGIGGTSFTPILNQPEVAILGVSRTTTEPVWRDNQFVPRQMLPLSLSYDHRVIDGAAGVRFTSALVAALADPRGLLEAVP